MAVALLLHVGINIVNFESMVNFFTKSKRMNHKQLKEGITYPCYICDLDWDILGKEKPFNPVTGVCRL